MVATREEGHYGEDISLFWRQNAKFKTVAKLGANGHMKEIQTWVSVAKINWLLKGKTFISYCGTIIKRSHI